MGHAPPAAGTSARAVVHEATATVIECVDPAIAVILQASAPVIEHVATSPAEYGVPVPSGHLQRPLQSCA